MNALHRVPKKGLKTTEMQGKPLAKLVPYFSLKDKTPGCAAGRIKTRFPFDLRSDRDEAVCKQFAVMKEKRSYGKKVRGIERSTFVVDAHRLLAREWRAVMVPGHAQEVLNFAKAL